MRHQPCNKKEELTGRKKFFLLVFSFNKFLRKRCRKNLQLLQIIKIYLSALFGLQIFNNSYIAI